MIQRICFRLSTVAIICVLLEIGCCLGPVTQVCWRNAVPDLTDVPGPSCFGFVESFFHCDAQLSVQMGFFHFCEWLFGRGVSSVPEFQRHFLTGRVRWVCHWMSKRSSGECCSFTVTVCQTTVPKKFETEVLFPVLSLQSRSLAYSAPSPGPKNMILLSLCPLCAVLSLLWTRQLGHSFMVPFCPFRCPVHGSHGNVMSRWAEKAHVMWNSCWLLPRTNFNLHSSIPVGIAAKTKTPRHEKEKEKKTTTHMSTESKSVLAFL